MNTSTGKNIGPFLAFTPDWFNKRQRVLLFLLNFPVTKRWFRWVLRIRRTDCPLDTRITAIAPNSFSYGDRYFKKGKKWYVERTTDFRTHPKFAKRIYFVFKYVWWALHAWDLFFADRFVPRLSFKFDTLTTYPQPGTGTAPIDGWVQRDPAQESFSSIRGGAGTAHDDTVAQDECLKLRAGTSSDLWILLMRSGYGFDTSSIGTNTISAAVLSLFGTNKLGNLGATNFSIVSFAPASQSDFVNADYAVANFGSTVYGTVTFSAFSTTAYNDFTLDANGRTYINKTGNTMFGARTGFDVDNSPPEWSSLAATSFSVYFADNAGTANDPKLVVTHAGVAKKVRSTLLTLKVG